MKVLVIGGSGHVAGLILPHLKEKYELRVFDMKPPADSSLEYVEGSVTDLEALVQAMTGMDAFLYLAMGTLGLRASDREIYLRALDTAFDVNVKGVYYATRAAHEARVPHAVYASSLSIYKGGYGRAHPDSRYYAHEDMVPDALDRYGLTKRLGEDVFRAAALQWGLTVNALRLCRPLSMEDYQERMRLDIPHIATEGSDVARAFDAALQYRPTGFEAFFISGDYDEQMMSMAKAKKLLGWEPLTRPTKMSDGDERERKWQWGQTENKKQSNN